MSYKDKNKQREYGRTWIANRRAAFFQGKKCTKCNTEKGLQLDHIVPKLKVSHNIWSWSKERQDNELQKCQILCKECHKNKTANDFNFYRHGTNNQYDRGCRCISCKEVKRIKNSKRSRIAC